MADNESSNHRRASLQGKGRAILLGSHAAPSDLAPPAEDEAESGQAPPPEVWAPPPVVTPGAGRPLYEAPGPSIGTAQSPNAVDEVADLAEPREGGLIIEPRALLPVPEAIGDPFGSPAPRAPSNGYFKDAVAADPALVNKLVPDEAVRQLWMQIEALQEDVIRVVRGDRCETDTYQKDLLDASALLLEKRENYDNARAIVNRVRADLARQRVVQADIARYRPRLLGYYLAWSIAWAILMLIGRALIERAGLSAASGVPLVFYPVMFGVLGALVSGYLTLDRHTTHLRDFDPLHVSWYLFNPLLGAVMGLLMLLLYAIVNQDVIRPGAAEPMEQVVVWLLCALAGMNQHAVLRHMFRLLDRLSTGS